MIACSTYLENFYGSICYTINIGFLKRMLGCFAAKKVCTTFDF